MTIRKLMSFFAMHSPEWHSDILMFPKLDINGKPITGYVMRRWNNGAWQYRAETEQEHIGDMHNAVW